MLAKYLFSNSTHLANNSLAIDVLGVCCAEFDFLSACNVEIFVLDFSAKKHNIDTSRFLHCTCQAGPIVQT